MTVLPLSQISSSEVPSCPTSVRKIADATLQEADAIESFSQPLWGTAEGPELLARAGKLIRHAKSLVKSPLWTDKEMQAALGGSPPCRRRLQPCPRGSEPGDTPDIITTLRWVDEWVSLASTRAAKSYAAPKAQSTLLPDSTAESGRMTPNAPSPEVEGRCGAGGPGEGSVVGKCVCGCDQDGGGADVAAGEGGASRCFTGNGGGARCRYHVDAAPELAPSSSATFAGLEASNNHPSPIHDVVRPGVSRTEGYGKPSGASHYPMTKAANFHRSELGGQGRTSMAGGRNHGAETASAAHAGLPRNGLRSNQRFNTPPTQETVGIFEMGQARPTSQFLHASLTNILKYRGSPRPPYYRPYIEDFFLSLPLPLLCHRLTVTRIFVSAILCSGRKS